MSSPKTQPIRPTSTASSSTTPVQRRTSTERNSSTSSTAAPPSPSKQFKKLGLSDDSTKSSSPSSSPAGARPKSKPTSPSASPTLQATPVRRSHPIASTSTTVSGSSSSSTTMSNSTPQRPTVTHTKAPVQSPIAAGLKMRPGPVNNGVNNLTAIGPSAMNAMAQQTQQLPQYQANPYSQQFSTASPSSPQQSPQQQQQHQPQQQTYQPPTGPTPGSPIASASPTGKRFKSPGASPTSSPIASATPTSAQQSKKVPPMQQAGQSGYEQPAAAAASSSSSSSHMTHSSVTGASYRSSHPTAHAPVNTHSHPPTSHVADHGVSNGPTIFSPVYSRTASQEQLHAQEQAAAQQAAMEKQKRDLEEERYRVSQAAVEAAAYANSSQQQHQVSYTPPQLDEDEFDPFLFIKNLPPLSPAMRNRKSPLPKKSLTAPKITLALDLDETLVHCSVQPIERAELTFKVAFNGMDYEVYVRTRPHMKEFLEIVSQWFEIIIFTASQKVYADKLLNILDPHNTYIKYRVFRDSCVCIDGNYLKDLHILGRDLQTVAIVDNSVQAFGFQLDNGIPIESWFDQDDDRELLNLIPFLRQLKDTKDVRPLIRDTFRLSEFVASL